MKNIFLKLSVLAILSAFAACRSAFPFSVRPDKEDFNSGTIGSVKATNAPSTDIVTNQTYNLHAPQTDTTRHLYLNHE